MKKFCYIALAIIAISILIISLKGYILNNTHVTSTLSQFYVKSLPEETIKALKGELTEKDHQQIVQNVIEATLKSLGLSSWLGKPLDYHIIFGNIYPCSGDEMIVAISVGKDNGIVAVFAKTGTDYELVGTLKNLVPVTNVAVLSLPGMATKALVVDEHLNELFGAFFEVSTKSVYIFEGRFLKKVWEYPYYEKIFRPEKNELKGNKTRWLRREKEVQIYFISAGNIELNGVITEARSKTLGDYNTEYEKLNSTTINEAFVWDNKRLEFLQIK